MKYLNNIKMTFFLFTGSRFKNIDKFIILIGGKERDGVTPVHNPLVLHIVVA